MTPLDCLRKYWGYSSFRPQQEAIVQSAIDGFDTLALLPTGGGKSICYQVPALILQKPCLVVSPLIALMKDQVEGLQSRGFSAQALFSGLLWIEQQSIIRQLLEGSLSFLFVAPERLASPTFLEHLEQADIGLIAIDEAHCISQWGHDFRPNYLKIAVLRELFPHIPTIALTASATTEVVKDITEHLHFAKDYKFFSQSFDRTNIYYNQLASDNKLSDAINYLSHYRSQTSIVYTDSRKSTENLAQILTQQGLSAKPYHAGLTHAQRNAHQDEWLAGKVDTIVATNAFGMGIDKPNVRLVLHMALPATLEAYYQEAGRAGRDGLPSEAVVLFDPKEEAAASAQLAASIPTPDQIRMAYHALANYFQLPYEAHPELPLEFSLADFCKRNMWPVGWVSNALQEMENLGLILLSNAIFSPTSVRILASVSQWRMQAEIKPAWAPILNAIARLAPGAFSQVVPLHIKSLQAATNTTQAQIETALQRLHQAQVIQYLPARDQPTIAWLHPRLPADQLDLNSKALNIKRKAKLQKLRSAWTWLDTNRCKTHTLLQYFGQAAPKTCGHCDYCTQIESFFHMPKVEAIAPPTHSISMGDFLAKFHPILHPPLLSQVTRWVDQNIISIDASNTIQSAKP